MKANKEINRVITNKYIMKKIIARVIHYFNPKYFIDCTYYRLDKWGIEDVYEGEIIWIE